MEITRNTKLVSYEEKKEQEINRNLIEALDTIGDILGMGFGSITIHFHQGEWCPKIEIKKNLIKNVIKK